jgi:hypothetical protein
MITCSPCLVVNLHEVTKDSNVAYNAVIVVYPTNAIELFENGILVNFYEYDTRMPA